VTNNFEGAEIPSSSFADDDGSADADLREVLAQYAQTADAATARELLDLLVVARLLVPVVSVVDSMEEGVEKDSHLSSVEFQSEDGRKALIAFTGNDAVQMWDPEARPIPREAYIVAQGAVEQGYDAILLDLSGPTPVAIDGMLLSLLAIGPARFELLENELAVVCHQLEALDVVTAAAWELDDDEATIAIEVTSADHTLSTQVAQIMQESNLNALLDVPLNVTLSDHTS
jgi:SseB protein N-terminal domain